MVEISRGVDAAQVRRAARHTLFVEGRGEESIDYKVLSLLLQDIDISIKSLGPSSNVRSVARALRIHHADYYFLADRDHHDDATVECTWQRFPDENTDNLLIWRRREIENYFLIPEYLGKSRYLICTSEFLKECILAVSRQRIFLDAANLVILKLKQDLKKEWISTFKNTMQGFETREKALQKLLVSHATADKQCDIRVKLQSYPIANTFSEIVDSLFGGQEELTFSQGIWLAMVKGKHVLPTVIDKCFQVRDATGKFLQGTDRLIEVAKDLVRLPLEQQPNDFQELHKLLYRRVKAK